MNARTESISLLDTLFPRATHGQNALLVAGGTLLLAASAQISIPLPFSPVPVTGQTFAVLLLGATFGPYRAAAACGLYLLEGLAGLPVFAPGGLPGAARFAGPTAGYLLSYPGAAFLLGWLMMKLPRRMPYWLGAATLTTACFFASGVTWLKLLLEISWSEAMALGLLPFLPGAAVKIALLTAVLPASWWAAEKVRDGQHS